MNYFRDLSTWEPWTFALIPVVTVMLFNVMYTKLQTKRPKGTTDLSFLPEEFATAGYYDLHVGTYTYNLLFLAIYFAALYGVISHIYGGKNIQKVSIIASVPAIAIFLLYTIGVSAEYEFLTAANIYIQIVFIYLVSVFTINYALYDQKQKHNFIK